MRKDDIKIISTEMDLLCTQSAVEAWRRIKKELEELSKTPTSKSSPKLLCDSCNMLNCKLRIEFGILAVECNEYME